MGGYSEGQVHVDLEERGQGREMVCNGFTLSGAVKLAECECDPALNMYC